MEEPIKNTRSSNVCCIFTQIHFTWGLNCESKKPPTLLVVSTINIIKLIVIKKKHTQIVSGRYMKNWIHHVCDFNILTHRHFITREDPLVCVCTSCGISLTVKYVISESNAVRTRKEETESVNLPEFKIKYIFRRNAQQLIPFKNLSDLTK